MSLCRFHKNLKKCVGVSKRFATTVRNEEEYTITANYPPILDLSYEKRFERKKETAHEEIKAVKTIEEKQIKLNMPRYYGFLSFMLLEDCIPYNNLTLAQHVTRTHLIVSNDLPDFYKSLEINDLAANLKSEIEEALLIELDGYRRTHDLKGKDLSEMERENIISSSVVKQVNRILLNNLAKSYAHLFDIQVDLDPRIESTWYVGGMNPPEFIKSKRREVDWTKKYENDPVDRLMVYIGSPSLALRAKLPLKPIVPYSEAENPDLDVPFFQYDPQVVDIDVTRRHMANVPGYWPGDPYGFGLISYHKRGHMFTRKINDSQDNKEALHRQGILASFGWLSAQANFLGFSTFNDITYPLVTQTVITNGQLWSLYAYQLNTMLFHSKYVKENLKKNICWATEELKLYEGLENGKIIGLNEDVFKLILKFYVNIPESRLGVNITPYLGSKENLVANYQNPEKREWLEREYKYLVSNRPRHKLMDEIYDWERIYKIENQTRFMEKRLRPFELFIKPLKRTLDDRRPIYIPRKHRPHLPRWKGRYKEEFFP